MVYLTHRCYSVHLTQGSVSQKVSNSSENFEWRWSRWKNSFGRFAGPFSRKNSIHFKKSIFAPNFVPKWGKIRFFKKMTCIFVLDFWRQKFWALIDQNRLRNDDFSRNRIFIDFQFFFKKFKISNFFISKPILINESSKFLSSKI